MHTFISFTFCLFLPVFAWGQTIVNLGSGQILESVNGLSDASPYVTGAALGDGVRFDLSITASSESTASLNLSHHPDGIGIEGGSYYEIDNRNNLDPIDDESMRFTLSNVEGLAAGESLQISAIGTRSLGSSTKQYTITDASGTRSGSFNTSPYVIEVLNAASASLAAVGPSSGTVVYSRFIVNQLQLTVLSDGTDGGDPGEGDGTGGSSEGKPATEIIASGMDVNGQPFFSYESSVGDSYEIQHSPDLEAPITWTARATHSGTGAPLTYADAFVDPANEPQGFYRAKTVQTPSGALTNTTLTITQTWDQEPNGYDRTADVLVPSGAGPHPVVIMLHGNGGNANFINSMGSALDSSIRVAPNGYLTSWNIDKEASKAPDVAFIGELIALLKSYDNVDAGRISIYGSSNGAGMTNRLLIDLDGGAFQRAACRVSQMIAKMYHDDSFWTDAAGDNSYSDATSPAPGRQILTISGDADPLIPYTGGNGVGTTFIDAQESIYRWAQAMGETGAQITDAEGTVGNLNDSDGSNDFSPAYVQYRYLDGAVLHYKLIGGNHGLQVNGDSAYSSEANQIIADFLLQ